MINTDQYFDRYAPYLDLAGRLLIAAIFWLSAIPQIQGFEGTQGFMESKGIPGMLLSVVIALEIVGSIAVIAGWRVRFFCSCWPLSFSTPTFPIRCNITVS